MTKTIRISRVRRGRVEGVTPPKCGSCGNERHYRMVSGSRIRAFPACHFCGSLGKVVNVVRA